MVQKLKNSVNTNVLVIDATGKTVMQSKINGTSVQLNVDELPSGIYQVIIPGATTHATRFQKMK